MARLGNAKMFAANDVLCQPSSIRNDRQKFICAGGAASAFQVINNPMEDCFSVHCC